MSGWVSGWVYTGGVGQWVGGSVGRCLWTCVPRACQTPTQPPPTHIHTHTHTNSTHTHISPQFRDQKRPFAPKDAKAVRGHAWGRAGQAPKQRCHTRPHTHTRTHPNRHTHRHTHPNPTLTLTPTGGRAGRRAAPLVPALPRRHRRNPNPNQNPVRLTLIGRHGVAPNPNPNPQQVAEVLDAMEYAVYVHDVTHILLDNLQVCVCVCMCVCEGLRSGWE